MQKPAFALCGLLTISLSSVAAEWPQFRGPRASGVDTNHALPVEWNVESGKNVRWQTPLPGLGHASPIISGDRIYVATAIGASANVVVLGIAARNGHPISFWTFTKYGLVVTAVTIACCVPYIWFRYHGIG